LIRRTGYAPVFSRGTFITPHGSAVPRTSCADFKLDDPRTGQYLWVMLSVLVVEDHEDAREMLGELLSLFGARVRLADGVTEALAAIEEATPDVVFCDLCMPYADGYDLAVALEQHPCRRQMRLVALTGFLTQAAQRRALAQGFEAVLEKPLLPEVLETFLKASASRPFA